MKKISVLFFVSLLFVSCSAKKASKEDLLKSLKGEWVYKANAESEVVSEVPGEKKFHGELIYEIDSRITFFEDYSFVVTNSTSVVSYKPVNRENVFSEEEVKSHVNQSNTMDGFFEITPKVLTLNYSQSEPESVSYVFEENKLVLTPNYKNAKTTVYYKSE